MLSFPSICFLKGCWGHAAHGNQYDRDFTTTIFCCNCYYGNGSFQFLCLFSLSHIYTILEYFVVTFMTCSIAFYDTTQVAENLAQLMYNVLMTGYMFRNAQYRLELQQSLEQIALPEPEEEKVSCPPLSPCTSKRYMFMIKRLPCSYPSFLWLQCTQVLVVPCVFFK